MEAVIPKEIEGVLNDLPKNMNVEIRYDLFRFNDDPVATSKKASVVMKEIN